MLLHLSSFPFSHSVQFTVLIVRALLLEILVFFFKVDKSKAYHFFSTAVNFISHAMSERVNFPESNTAAEPRL